MVTMVFTGTVTTASSSNGNQMNLAIRNNTLEDFFSNNYRKLVARAKGRAGTKENAEDIVQESFVRAMKYWGSFDPAHKELGAWFNTILNNATKAYMKVENNFGMSMEFDENSAEPEPFKPTDVRLIKRIEVDISKKNPSNQDVLRLYFLKDYTARAIVEVLDIDIKTVEKCILRFKTELSVKYGEPIV